MDPAGPFLLLAYLRVHTLSPQVSFLTYRNNSLFHVILVTMVATVVAKIEPISTMKATRLSLSQSILTPKSLPKKRLHANTILALQQVLVSVPILTWLAMILFK